MLRNVERKYELIFVTKNTHKFLEVREIAKLYGIKLTQVADVPKIEIQAEESEDIAFYSALNAVQHFKKPLVLEDSGLYINALNGFPGPYSSYVFKKIGNKGILKLMRGVKDRSAKFICVVAFAHPRYGIRLFRGEVKGVISQNVKGNKGFGFDPIFIPEGSSKTFSEMDINEKNMYSHRSKAFKQFFQWLVRHLNLLI